jgi:hypothetical protein
MNHFIADPRAETPGFDRSRERDLWCAAFGAATVALAEQRGTGTFRAEVPFGLNEPTKRSVRQVHARSRTRSRQDRHGSNVHKSRHLEKRTPICQSIIRNKNFGKSLLFWIRRW